MRRRIDIAIDRLTVDPSMAGNRASLAAAIERALAERLGAPGALDRFSPRTRDSVDAGTLPSSAFGPLAARIGDVVAGEGGE